MNRQQLQTILYELDSFGIYVFTTRDLHLRFQGRSEKTFEAALKRHTKSGMLLHPARGVYINPHAKSQDPYTLEHIAKALRRGKYSYISLESMLSEIGVISQVPMSVLTVMTTGRSQTYKTPYGTIEFTHTKRSTADILNHTYFATPRPLRLAKRDMAISDLKRVGRNTDLILLEEAS